MKKLDNKIILLLLLTISSICFGNTQIITNITSSEPTNLTEIEPLPAATENIDAWIIIAGDRSDHNKRSLIQYGCNKAYQALINLGYHTGNIFYLGPQTGPSQPYVNRLTSRSNIQYAIQNWAASRVDATKSLGIYMFDHGDTNSFCIPGEDLTDTDLNSYLDTLETNIGCNRIILIYEACHAGSFINPLSKDNRIIIAATDITHGSYVNLDWTWATFSETFFSSIIACKTIGVAFEDAEANVEAVGDGDIQFPLIDDNHDEVGHEVDASGNLPNGGDGLDALNIRIGTSSSCTIVIILHLPLMFFINFSSYYIPMWSVIDTNSIMERVYARIIPPNWTPTEIETDEEGSKLGIHPGIEVVQLFDQDGDGNYTGNLYNPNNPDFWNTKGDYKVNIIARSEDGGVANIESTYITVNDDGKAPPDTTPPTISITNPLAFANVSGVINITAEGDDDQALDKIQIFLDGVLLKEEAMPPYLPYPEAVCNLNTSNYINGLHNITAIAIDNANNVKQTSIAINIQNGLQIPGFQITTLFIGSLLGVIFIIYCICKKGLKGIKINR